MWVKHKGYRKDQQNQRYVCVCAYLQYLILYLLKLLSLKKHTSRYTFNIDGNLL